MRLYGAEFGVTVKSKISNNKTGSTHYVKGDMLKKALNDSQKH